VRELSSHEAFVLAVEDGRIVRLFHYVHDPDGFAAFSASRVCRCRRRRLWTTA